MDSDKKVLMAFTCPRCGMADATVVANSPQPGIWTVKLCSTCFYSWRSNEPIYATQAETLASTFRIDPARLSEGHVMPEIPPRRIHGDAYSLAEEPLKLR